MKLEQKRMYEVDGHGKPYEADVIYKNDKPFISSSAGDDDFYQLGDSGMLFDTKEEADKYYSKITSKFDAKEIKKYIEEIGCYSDKLKEMLPDDIYQSYKIGRDSSMCLSYKEKSVLRMALNGILNIDAMSFRLDDIDYVKYGIDWLSIVLKNGEEITPKTDIEVFIIKSIYGDNNSSREFTNIKKPKDL